MNLSDRLTLIANQINQGETMADIGTDHGFLPIYLWESGICPKVIMADISEGSLNKAKINCETEHPENTFDFRLGNGIDVLKTGEVDAVVIAGMGGLLITDILGWNLEKSHSMDKYILQPRNNTGRLRHWLVCNGFIVTKELLVRESRFIWEVLVAANSGKNTAQEFPLYNEVFDYPDSLIEFRGPLTKEFLEKRLGLETHIYNNIINKGKDVKTQVKDCEIKILRIEHLLSELEKLQ